MIQQIKIWNQSVDILGNYAKIWNARNSFKQHAFSTKIRFQSIYPS